jgi:DNA-binding NarL/FixJ family response regulator
MGKTNRQIATLLSLSLRSVEKEVADLKAKLGLETINELLMFGTHEGLLHPELLYRQTSG